MSDAEGNQKSKNSVSCGGCLLLIVGGIIALTIAGSYLPKPTPTETPSEAPSSEPVSEDRSKVMLRAKPAPIEPEAIKPYTSAEYPKFVSRWGRAIPAINRDRKRAAEIAAKDERCDRVFVVQITTGSPRRDRHYYAECENTTRFFFDETGLRAGQPSDVQTLEDMKREGLKDW